MGKAIVLFEDGTVEDLAGEGTWHIEQMRPGFWYFGAELEGEFVKFWLTVEDGDIRIEPYENEEHLKTVFEEREGKTRERREE